MVLDWLLEYDLILLNGDSKCVGQYTWGRQEQRSAIDFVLVNKELHRHFSEMRIDEEKQVIDLSDHNLVTVAFKATKKVSSFGKGKWEEIVYYSKKKQDLEKYIKCVEEIIKINRVDTIEDMNSILVQARNETLTKRYKRKVTPHYERKE